MKIPVALCLVLLAAPLAAYADVTVSYQGPEDRKEAAPSDFSFHAWDAGAVAFTAVDGARLRSGAFSESEVVAELPLATAVRIEQKAGGAVRVGARVDVWYRVSVTAGEAAGRTGYLFGGTLTPAAWELDLDGDGAREAVTVAWSPDYRPRVRVRDGDSVEVLDLEAGGQAYVCCGGNLDVALVPAVEAGVPLVRVRSSVEACGDYLVAFVSWDGKVLRKALETMGLVDPPNVARPEVTFDAAARTATVRIVGPTEDDGEAVVSVDRFVLREGRYVGVDAKGAGPEAGDAAGQPPAPEAGETPEAGGAPGAGQGAGASSDAAGPSAAAAGLAEPPSPPAGLQACAACASKPSAAHCAACRARRRCVQSLLDPTWASLQDAGGHDLYAYEDGTWRKRLRIARGEGLDALGRELRTFPRDLELYLTLGDACPPADPDPAASVAAYFEPGFAGTPPEIRELRVSREDPDRAEVVVEVRAAGRADSWRGSVYLHRDRARCEGWKVVAFGTAACPGAPAAWPADLRR